MRARSALAASVFAGLWLAASCLDISSPVDGIASITPVIAPSPSVVVGDSLRDTLGDVAALRVVAFAPNGDTVRDARVEFFVLDTTRKLLVESSTGKARGDSLSPNAQVVARVTPAEGSGSLQTLPLPLPVVPVPQMVVQDSAITLFTFSPTATDTLSATLLSPPISVTVRGGTDTVVQKYLVSYELVEAPPSSNSEPSVVLVGDDGRASTVDTTDASGHAVRRLRARLGAMPGNVLLGTDTVTAKILAHVRYRGQPLPGSPVEFTIPLTGSGLR